MERLTSEAVIAGGGMVGMTLGLALAQGGIATTVVDALPPTRQLDPKFDGRVSALAFASVRMLKALGAWEAMAPHAQPINDILVSDGRLANGVRAGGAASAFLHFDHREIGAEPLGHIVENRHIRASLMAAAERTEGLTLIAPAGVASATPAGGAISVGLADGREIAAKVCLAADGRESALREAAGIKTVEWRYPQTGIVATVAHERGHDGVAQEFFLPSGPFAILPMTGNRSSLVWTEAASAAPAFMKLPEEAFAAAIAQRFGDHLGPTRPVGPRWSYPLAFHLARRYLAERLALVGDAAHGIHPIAGQGLNLGLRDVAALAESLVDAARLGLDIGGSDVLETYQRWRRFDNAALAVATDGLNRLFSNDIAPLRLARDIGLALTNAVPPARRFFMRHAGGVVALGGEARLPRLLRGEPV